MTITTTTFLDNFRRAFYSVSAPPTTRSTTGTTTRTTTATTATTAATTTTTKNRHFSTHRVFKISSRPKIFYNFPGKASKMTTPNPVLKNRIIQDVGVAEEPNRRYRSNMEDACVIIENFGHPHHQHQHHQHHHHHHRHHHHHTFTNKDCNDDHEKEKGGKDGGQAFFGVYDGHGGRLAVDVIKVVMHRCLEEALERQEHNWNDLYRKGGGGKDDDDNEEGSVGGLIEAAMAKGKMHRGFWYDFYGGHNHGHNHGHSHGYAHGRGHVHGHGNRKRNGYGGGGGGGHRSFWKQYGKRYGRIVDNEESGDHKGKIKGKGKRKGKTGVDGVTGNRDDCGDGCGNRSKKCRLPSRLNPVYAFQQAYRAVDQLLLTKGCFAAGATAVTCFLQTHSDGTQVLYTANCGDARAVLVRGDRPVRLSHDHKPFDVNEVKRIRESGGFVTDARVNGVLGVARALGDHSMKRVVISRPYVRKEVLTSKDSALILACDGLWDVVSDLRAVRIVNAQFEKNHDAQAAAKKLVRTALALGSTDNITVIVVKLMDHQGLPTYFNHRKDTV